MSTGKLSGFTLLEMIITMIISSIMIVIFYNVIDNLYKEWTVFRKRQNEITNTLLFKSTLDNDLNRAIYVVDKGNRQLVMISQHDTITYQFAKQVIRFQHPVSDTFGISLSACQFVPLQSMKRISLIREINMDIAGPIEMKNVSFYKYYTSGELMNLFPEQDGY